MTTLEFRSDRGEQGDTVVPLVRHCTCDSQVAGSSPGWAPPRSGLGQATYTLCASVTKQYNLAPAKRQGCSSAGKVTVGLAESNGNLCRVYE